MFTETDANDEIYLTRHFGSILRAKPSVERVTVYNNTSFRAMILLYKLTKLDEWKTAVYDTVKFCVHNTVIKFDDDVKDELMKIIAAQK
jgi:hypothetical protein